MKEISLEEKLDKDMKFISEFKEVYFTTVEFTKGTDDHHTKDEIFCLQKLFSDWYIYFIDPDGFISLTPKGKMFLHEGGYTKEKERKLTKKRRKTTLFVITIISVTIALASLIFSFFNL